MPVPTIIEILPARPNVADPVPTRIAPLLPPLAEPEPMLRLPLLPVVEVPVLRINRPLFALPYAPALAVCSTKLPDVVLLLYPEVMETLPPVLADEVVPAERTNSPPEPLLPLPTMT